MIKACIFDCDGTVANTLETIAYYSNQSLISFGIEPIEVEQYKYFTGNGVSRLISGMLAYRGVDSQENRKKILDRYNELYLQDVCFKTTVFPGLKESLRFLKSQGVKNGILSNKQQPALEKVAEQFFTDGEFDLAWGDQEGYPKKPDPTRLLQMLEQFKAKPEECLYFGDTDVDMITGKSAGCITVGVTWGFRSCQELEQNHADIIIDDPKEIISVFLDKQAKKL